MMARGAGLRVVRMLAALMLLAAPFQWCHGSDFTVEKSIPGKTYEYRHEVMAEIPWSAHVFKISRRDPDLEFETTFGDGRVFGAEIVSAQLKSAASEGRTVLAAVNGDFYLKRPGFEWRPRDLQISHGEILSEPAEHSVFWLDTNGSPHLTNVLSLFKVVWEDGSATPLGLNEERAADAAVLYTPVSGASTHSTGGVELVLEPEGGGPWLPLKPQTHYTARVKAISTSGNTPLPRDGVVLSLGPKLAALSPAAKVGSMVRFATDTFPSLAGVKAAIGGGAMLVSGGKSLVGSWALARHPRTAFGWSNEYYYLVEVDGRQSDLSVGMSMPELADYLLKIGCEEAVNLDGGGSATLWALGKVMNSPSEGKERPCPNALVVLHKSGAVEKVERGSGAPP